MCDGLPVFLQEKLNRIFDRGYLRRGDIEDYVLDELDSTLFYY